MKRAGRPQQKRGEDLCHMAFRQTLDLLKVTDEVIAELCHETPVVPLQDALVLRAMNEMALGVGAAYQRAPTHVSLVHGTGPEYDATVYGLGAEGYAPASRLFRFTADQARAFSMGLEEVKVSNAEDDAESVEAYQTLFHPTVRRTVGVPIRNFITYRILGDKPGAIVAYNYPDRATRYEAQVLSALAITLGSTWTLASRVGQVEEAFLYLVGALARASEANDQVTGDHILRVSRYAEVLALAAGLSEREARVIAYSSQLHDVGKIHTPREILRKMGRLSPEEVRIVEEHTWQGEKIIGTSPRLDVARRIAAAHHECWDGSGYPRNLAGEEIPKEARLVKIVDVYDALRSERPYKPAFSHEKACEILLSGDSRIEPARHFDPAFLSVFQKIHGDFQRIHAEIQA